MKILIIEPHGDDALISCSRVLRSGARVDILTLASRPSYKLRDHFDNVRVVEYVDAEDYHWDNRPVNHVQVNRWYKEGLNPFAEYMRLISNQEGVSSKILDVMTHINDFVSQTEYDLVLAPLGVVHPFHCVVRTTVDIMYLDGHISLDSLAYYSEGPYNAKKYGKLLESGAISSLGYRGLTVKLDSDIDWQDEKESIYRKVYPTETSLFRFSYDEVIKNDELYIGDYSALTKLKEIIK